MSLPHPHNKIGANMRTDLMIFQLCMVPPLFNIPLRKWNAGFLNIDPQTTGSGIRFCFFKELNLNQTLFELIIYLKLFGVKSITNGTWQGLQQEKKLQVGIRTKVEDSSSNLILRKYAYLTKQFPWITLWSVHND